MYVISLINMKGGVGKTTLTVNISHCLSSYFGYRVLTIDLDPQFNATQCVLSEDDYKRILKEGDTIVDFLKGKPSTPINSVYGVMTKQPKSYIELVPQAISDKWHVIPGSLAIHKYELSSESGKEYKIKQYLESLRSKDLYDFVIIDTPPTPSLWMLSALVASDYYLIPTRPDPLSIVGLEALEAIVSNYRDTYRLEIKCLGVILNIVDKNNLTKDTIREFNRKSVWSVRLFNGMIPRRVNIARYQLENQFILDSREAEAKLELIEITRELLDRIGKSKSK